MEQMTATAAPAFVYRLRAMPRRLREWAIQCMLRAIVRLSGDSNTIQHAKRELGASLTAEPGPDRWMAEGLLELLAVYVSQGHSGFSAPICADWFQKLARFQPLGPLTGADDEWFDHGDGMFQNKRCGHVFKQPDRFNGQAYDLDGRIFREPSGSCYTNSDSMVPITFPYTPKREYVDVE